MDTTAHLDVQHLCLATDSAKKCAIKKFLIGIWTIALHGIAKNHGFMMGFVIWCAIMLKLAGTGATVIQLDVLGIQEAHKPTLMEKNARRIS